MKKKRENKEHIKSGKAEEARLVDMGEKALEDQEKVAKKEKELEKEILAKTKKTTLKKNKIRSNRYKNLKKEVDPQLKYAPGQATALTIKTANAGFDESLEVHLALTEKVSGTVTLPHGTGKKVRVAVADEAIIAKIEKGQINFDVLVATPAMMPKLAKLARVLGPKGLMPNPKTGTITDNPAQAVKKLEAGQTRFKSEPKAPLLHFSIGKISFGEEKLTANLTAFLTAVGKKNILRASICSTMGPSIKLDLEKI